MKPYEKQCALSGTDTIFVRIHVCSRKVFMVIFLLFHNNLSFNDNSSEAVFLFLTNASSICHDATCIALNVNV